MATTAIDTQIESVLTSVSQDHIGVVAAADKLMALFKEAGLLREMHIHCTQVGFDPANRDGQGGSALGVLSLAHDIAMVGWSWEQVSHALCVEVTPGDTSVEDFNRKLCADSGLAPVSPNTIAFGSLACGHTNMGLRAIAAGMPSEDPLLAEDGRLSTDKISKRDAEFGKAVREGLRWHVLSHEVRTRFAAALPVLQAARNVAGHVHRGENEVQAMCRLHAMAAAQQARGEAANWVPIRRAVLRTRPPFAERLDELVAFVAGKSGGANGDFLAYMASCHRLFVDPSTRTGLPAPLYAVLADFRMQYLAMAFWLTAYTCPPEHVRHGMCSWVTGTEVASLAKSKDLEVSRRVSEAEAALKEARLRLKGVPVPIHGSNGLAKVFCLLDISMGRFVLGKQERSAVQHKSVAGVGLAFLENLAKAFPTANMEAYAGLWSADVSAPAATLVAPEATAAMPLYEISEAGERTTVLALLRERGLDVGGTVTSDGGSFWRVVAVRESAKAVELEAATASAQGAYERRVVDVGAFCSDYTVADAKAVVVLHPGWPAEPLMLSATALTLRIRGLILAGLSQMAAELQRKHPLQELLVVRQKPVRAVFTKVSAPEGTILLAPETMVVKAVPRSDEMPPGAVEVACNPPDETSRFFLLPAGGNGPCVPMWHVRTTDVQKDATMVMQHWRTSVLVAGDFEGTTPLAESPGRPARRITAKSAPEDYEKISLAIPVLVNAQGLAAETELVRYVPTGPKKVRIAPEVTLARVSKKAR